MAIEFGVAIERFVNREQQVSAPWKSDWLGAFEHGLMILVALIGCDGGRPTAVIAFSINCISDAEAGRFHIG